MRDLLKWGAAFAAILVAAGLAEGMDRVEKLSWSLVASWGCFAYFQHHQNKQIAALRDQLNDLRERMFNR